MGRWKEEKWERREGYIKQQLRVLLQSASENMSGEERPVTPRPGPGKDNMDSDDDDDPCPPLRPSLKKAITMKVVEDMAREEFYRTVTVKLPDYTASISAKAFPGK